MTVLDILIIFVLLLWLYLAVRRIPKGQKCSGNCTACKKKDDPCCRKNSLKQKSR